MLKHLKLKRTCWQACKAIKLMWAIPYYIHWLKYQNWNDLAPKFLSRVVSLPKNRRKQGHTFLFQPPQGPVMHKLFQQKELCVHEITRLVTNYINIQKSTLITQVLLYEIIHVDFSKCWRLSTEIIYMTATYWWKFYHNSFLMKDDSFRLQINSYGM